MEALIAQALGVAATELTRSIVADPVPFMQGLDSAIGQLFSHHHHTGYDAIQDIWDSVEAGHLSHSAALQATAILAGDLERRRQRSAAPQPPAPSPKVQPSPLDEIRRYAEYPCRVNA